MKRLILESRGAQLIEAALIALPFFGLLFLLIDISWSVFVKATLQHAVREGARYAITGQLSGGQGQIDSIKAVVQSNAMGLLSGAQSSRITITFLAPDTLASSDNQGGNIVVVAVEGYRFVPLAPLLHSGRDVLMTVRSGDRLEPSPGGVAPRL